MKCLLLDVGGARLKKGIIADGEIKNTDVIRTPPTLNKLLDYIENVANMHGVQNVALAVAGPVQQDMGIWVRAINPFPIENVNLREKLEERDLHLSLLMQDTHASAIGESQGEDVIFIQASTGLGIAIVKDGNLLLMNKEWGHSIYKENNIHCSCGKEDCYSTYISLGAIRARISPDKYLSIQNFPQEEIARAVAALANLASSLAKEHHLPVRFAGGAAAAWQIALEIAIGNSLEYKFSEVEPFSALHGLVLSLK